MPKFLIFIKKHLYTKPKWRILRIFTKIVKRSSLEKIQRDLEKEISTNQDPVDKAFLQGQLEVIKYFLN